MYYLGMFQLKRGSRVEEEVFSFHKLLPFSPSLLHSLWKKCNCTLHFFYIFHSENPHVLSLRTKPNGWAAEFSVSHGLPECRRLCLGITPRASEGFWCKLSYSYKTKTLPPLLNDWWEQKKQTDYCAYFWEQDNMKHKSFVDKMVTPV